MPPPSNLQVPCAFQIGELFKISECRTMRIEALVIPAPDRMRWGWPD